MNPAYLLGEDDPFAVVQRRRQVVSLASGSFHGAQSLRVTQRRSAFGEVVLQPPLIMESTTLDEGLTAEGVVDRVGVRLAAVDDERGSHPRCPGLAPRDRRAGPGMRWRSRWSPPSLRGRLGTTSFWYARG